MLEIRGRSARLCDGLSRRSFLKIGALGLTGPTLADILRIRETQAASERRETSVILFWMAGGPSHLDTYDMKPNAPAEVRGPFRTIATKVPGLDVCELMPQHARIADRLTVIRSLHHAHSEHNDAAHWVQTGYPNLNARLVGQRYPAQGAAVSYLRGPRQPGMPAYVCIPESYSPRFGFFQSAAYLGPRHNPLSAGGDPNLGNYRTAEFTLPAEISLARLQERRGLLKALDVLVRKEEGDGTPEAMDQSQQRAFELVTGPQAQAAFDLTREPERLRASYGPHFWGHSALLARRLVEAGVTFVTINLYEKDVDWWDDHTQIEKNLRKRVPPFDQALAALIEDLHERGLSENVLVVACGEFGRSPRIDKQAGRGHWPGAMSALLSGGGIKTGQIIGATTRDGGTVAQRPLTPGDLLASIYQVLGIDPSSFLHDRENRPIRLAGDGEPIRELFG